jgi:predicted transcriptional regulator
VATNDRLALVARIASNYLRRNSIAADQIVTVVRNATEALAQAERQLNHRSESGTGTTSESTADAASSAPTTPAVPVGESVQRDYLVCLEEGQHVRTLKRHLQSAHGMTPQQYRIRWSLPRDYPMSAPEYSESRSALAKARGLGRKAAAEPERAAAATTRRRRTAAPKKSGRGRAKK